MGLCRFEGPPKSAAEAEPGLERGLPLCKSSPRAEPQPPWPEWRSPSTGAAEVRVTAKIPWLTWLECCAGWATGDPWVSGTHHVLLLVHPSSLLKEVMQ